MDHGSRSLTVLRDTDQFDPLIFSDLDGQFAFELLSLLIKQ